MSPERLRALFDRPRDRLIQHYRDMATIVEDEAKRTFMRVEPVSQPPDADTLQLPERAANVARR